MERRGVVATMHIDLTPKPGIWLMQNTELGRGWLDIGRDGMRNDFSLS